ncbi:MAG TPA: response regulator [Herpetosiphonaceae bacterium]|nr:response regulator [Herpetosiphonaceae bacterium]
MGAIIYQRSHHAGHDARTCRRKRKPVVLVVDDEQPILRVVQDVLEDEGFSVLVAPNGSEGLAIAVRERPDVIITDFMLPGINGRALRERLKHDPRTARIPVLLMSAAYKPQPEDGFVGVIPKPFSIDELVQRAYQHLA